MMYPEEAYRKVSGWLASSGVELESGKVLDSQGCCFVSRGEEDGCLIMLPPNQTTLYFIATLYTPDMHSNINLFAYCLELNCIFMTSLGTTAIGLDRDNRKLVLKGAHHLHHGGEPEFEAWLSDFLEKASQIRERITQFFHSGEVEPSDFSGSEELHSQSSFRPSFIKP